MREKLILKLIYFLLKYVDSDIMSFKQFTKELAEFANGRYSSAKVEATYSNGELLGNEFTVYVSGYNHLSASTPKGALDLLRKAPKLEPKINVIID